MPKTVPPKPAERECKKHPGQQVTLILDKVKVKLMSREPEQQKEAVAWLINELQSNSNVGQDLFIETLLKTELIALLCETTMTMQGYLVTTTLKCLACLKSSEAFYKQNHASYVIESILRTGHFLTLQVDTTRENFIMLESIAYTLEQLFKGAADFHVSPKSICEIKQIFVFFKKLLTSRSQPYRIIFSSARILSIVLRSTVGNESPKEWEDGNLVVSVVVATLRLMCRIIEAKNPTDGKYAFRAIVMTSAVCAAGIPSCSTQADRDNDQTSLHSSIASCRVELANCIYSSMMKAVIPNFNKIDLDEKNGQFYLWFVTCLNGIYEVMYSNSKDLSNYLVEQGFLRILPVLATLRTSNLRNETMLLFSRLLTTLAATSLFVDTWLGGAKQFQKFLINAFKSLPPDPSSWLSFVGQGGDRADALLVLFYYYFLRETSDPSAYLPPLVAYVRSLISKPKRKSVTIQKALWFIFSITAVSHEKPSSVRSYDEAEIRIFNDLESADLRQCYTHHPAIVVHALHSKAVSDKLRANVVCLWLENGGDVECLVDGSTVDVTTSHCLLEMVRTGSERTVNVGMKAISEVFKRTDVAAEIFGTIVWEHFPQTLASSNEKNGHNTTGVLKLASLFKPKEISSGTLVRSLYQLMNFISKNECDPTLVSLGIIEARYLLILSVNRDDARGVTMFTKEPRVLNVLKTFAFAKEDPGLSYTCFNCLSILIRCQSKYSIQCECSLEIGLEDLVKQLCSDECVGVLQLATAIFINDIEKPVVIAKDLTSGANCDEIIRALYLQVHVTHAKSVPKARELCYVLLVELLNRCSSPSSARILKNFCQQPWTNVLIQITLDSDQVMDAHFMHFASTWLSYRYSVLPRLSCNGNGRSLCRDEFEITLDRLAEGAVATFAKNPEEEWLPELVQSLLLFQQQISANIATELQQVFRQSG